jgi:hypothetical protein
MCLDLVTEIYDTPSPLIVDGWKSFTGTPANPKLSMSIKGVYEVPFDKWIQATDEHATCGIKADDHNTYAPGFHAYAEESRKPTQNLRRVFLRKITCLGQQDGKKTVVAQEMFVPSNPNGWPPKPDDPKSLVERAKNAITGNA